MQTDNVVYISSDDSDEDEKVSSKSSCCFLICCLCPLQSSCCFLICCAPLMLCAPLPGFALAVIALAAPPWAGESASPAEQPFRGRLVRCSGSHQARAATPCAACHASHQVSNQQQEEEARDTAGTFRFTRRSRTPLFWRWAALDTPVYERSTLRGLLCPLHALHCFARISMSSSARFALLCTGDNLVSRLTLGAPLSRPHQLLSALTMTRRKRRCLSRRAEPQASALLNVQHSAPRRPLRCKGSKSKRPLRSSSGKMADN